MSCEGDSFGVPQRALKGWQVSEKNNMCFCPYFVPTCSYLYGIKTLPQERLVPGELLAVAPPRTPLQDSQRKLPREAASQQIFSGSNLPSTIPLRYAPFAARSLKTGFETTDLLRGFGPRVASGPWNSADSPRIDTISIPPVRGGARAIAHGLQPAAEVPVVLG